MIRMESFPRIIRSTVGLLWATIINILASRVYRNTKSGLYLELVDGPNLHTIRFTESAQTSVTMEFRGQQLSVVLEGSGGKSLITFRTPQISRRRLIRWPRTGEKLYYHNK